MPAVARSLQRWRNEEEDLELAMAMAISLSQAQPPPSASARPGQRRKAPSSATDGGGDSGDGGGNGGDGNARWFVAKALTDRAKDYIENHGAGSASGTVGNSRLMFRLSLAGCQRRRVSYMRH